MPISQPNSLSFESEPKPETPIRIDSRSSQPNNVVCRCRCGCSCFQSHGDCKDECERSCSVAPLRGRSPTIRDVLMRNGEGPIQSRPAPRASEARNDADNASVQGEEGVEAHQIEVGDLGSHTYRSIEQEIARHNHCSCPAAPFNSPTDSMIAEPSTGMHSMASSGFLLPPAASPSASVGYTGGVFNTHDNAALPQLRAQPLLITPLWLNYEHHFCRNLEVDLGHGLPMHYPITLDMEEDEFREFDM